MVVGYFHLVVFVCQSGRQVALKRGKMGEKGMATILKTKKKKWPFRLNGETIEWESIFT